MVAEIDLEEARALNEAASKMCQGDDDMLESRLRNARTAHEALFGRSRGFKLPPPPMDYGAEYYAPYTNGVDYFSNGVLEDPSIVQMPYSTIGESPLGFQHNVRAPLTPREDASAFQKNRYRDPSYHSLPTPGFLTRAQSMPPIPTSSQFVIHTMTPVTVVTPTASPRKLDMFSDFDGSRAAVASCRMLAEAGRDFARRCADEASQKAYEEARLQGGGGGGEELRAENARLQEDLRVVMEQLQRLTSENARLQESENTAISLRTEVDGLRLMQSELENLKSREIGMAEDMRRKSQTTELENVQLSKEAQNLQRRTLALELERDEARDDRELLQKALNEKDDAIRSLRNSLDEEKTSIRLLREENDSQLGSLRQELDRVLAERNELVSDVEIIRRTGEEMQVELRQAKEDIEHYKRAGEERESTIKSLRTALQDEKVTLTALRADLDRQLDTTNGTRRTSQDSLQFTIEQQPAIVDPKRSSQTDLNKRESEASLQFTLNPQRNSLDSLGYNLGRNSVHRGSHSSMLSGKSLEYTIMDTTGMQQNPGQGFVTVDLSNDSEYGMSPRHQQRPMVEVDLLSDD
jgi:hypothetical protein